MREYFEIMQEGDEIRLEGGEEDITGILGEIRTPGERGRKMGYVWNNTMSGDMGSKDPRSYGWKYSWAIDGSERCEVVIIRSKEKTYKYI